MTRLLVTIRQRAAVRAETVREICEWLREHRGQFVGCNPANVAAYLADMVEHDFGGTNG